MASVEPGPTAAAQAAFAAALLDELARGGVRDVVVCPGSRSTPLVLAATATAGVRVHVRLDERGAGFFAIGRALADRAPVAIVVTSGTAAAELTPAVVEADLAGVPLVLLTADRPPELRGVGAPQTIDQVKLFGDAVRRYLDPGPIRPGSEAAWRPLAARALSAALVPPGPVHLNCPFVEPLDAAPSAVPPGRPGGAPWRTVRRATHASADVLTELSGKRVIVLAGRAGAEPALVAATAARHRWPLLADPLSGARADAPHVVAAFDALLGNPVLRDALAPDAVLALGAPPASRALGDALVAWAPRVIAVSPTGWPDDPHGLVTDAVVAPMDGFARAAAALEPLGGPAAYLAAWRDAEAAAQRAFDEACDGALTEPWVARALSREVPDGVPLVVSSSMPVRDLEWFGAKVPRAPRVLANRGANGIDGVVSTALGAACGGRAVGLLGDLAFLHDVGSLANGLGEGGGRCVLVVLDNRGGAIFSFLPQRGSVAPPSFERLFLTPPSVDPASAAAGLGCDVAEVKDLGALTDAVAAGLETDGVTVVVARVPDADANVALHRRLGEAAAAAARAAIGV